MDFGASAVWGDAPSLSTTTQPTATVSLFAPPKDDPFDEFDDFGDAKEAEPSQAMDDDDFGDFGDFADETVATNGQGHDHGAFGFADDELQTSTLQKSWSPLSLDPMPNSIELTEQVQELLSNVVQGSDIDFMLTGDGIRQIESPTQLLVSPDSRSLYKTLFEEAAPSLRAPNWIRSRIRRNHLIALGIPVNLDEVNPQANGRALPTLNIITRPGSAPPRPGSRQSRSRPDSRIATPVQTATTARYDSAANAAIRNLGPKPEIDQGKINMLLNLDPDNLPLLPIPKLEAHNAAIRAQTVAASQLLSYLLQSRDALQQDSDAFNKNIADLVNEAQRIKSGMRRTPAKRGSGM
ncbi:hypothetical protein M408DRAFT_331080 [Serendipita vermifera MAFF 305830]|uniref:Uncharacterized protein n=1 Tax=Serendipita vermifera MAFF 305830 TaxID=933852 RepID=A0A0C3ALQ3_SERVB|nr:hypothetical protein M408DRAFT_331080 [Serendipita vermifera MAFF 305830]